MYRWLVYFHIAGAFFFLTAHGVSIAVALRLRNERDRERIRTLLALSGSSTPFMWGGLFVLLAGGIAAGFAGRWWGSGWIWVSLVLLISISASMFPLATTYYRRVGDKTGFRPSGAPIASDEEIADLLHSSRPWLLAFIGFGGILAILFLMIFKPF
ncbi:MAG TPA: DUF2269 family protein [Actinomycetota bacterium]|nr:DUF2269 family protein [Actinomycetota bacterium]